MSERDALLNQRRNNAEQKRRELQNVVGLYRGLLKQSNGFVHNASLRLDIKDVPSTVDGQVDPVPVPTLAGYIRFNFGEKGEFLAFVTEKADFDLKRGQLSLVTTNGEYKQLKLEMKRTGPELRGEWSATSMAAGSAEFSRSDAPEGSLLTDQVRLRGTYQGKLRNTNPASALPERMQVNVVTTQDVSLPSGVRMSGSMRLYFGDFDSLEYVELPFASLGYNYFTRLVVAKVTEKYLLTVRADVEVGVLRGKLYDDALGEVGEFEVKLP